MGGSFWGVLTLGTIALLVLVIWSLRRQRAPRLHIQCDSPIGEVMSSLAGLTLGTIVPGNSVEVHENGAFFDQLVERIGAAQKSVHFETFLWKDGRLARRLVDAFLERARAGVEVRILLDANGGRRMGDDVRQQLRVGGCQLHFFHKHSLMNIGVLNDRDHRKLCVIDGREAFVGGHCVTDDWLGDAEDGKHFSDVSVHLHGPIVHTIASAFCDNWVGETGELFIGDKYFPELAPAGDTPIHAAFIKPSNSPPAVKILHHTAICLAKRRIWIQNPYFIPEPEAIAAFADAVKRGVDVRILMPATSGSDSPVVQYAGHRNFEKLLEGGVRLFEYPHTLLHQKIMTVDGIWSAVGSTNFDDRSFETNDEISLSILDESLATKFDAIFQKYVRRASEIELKRWRRRSVVHKVRERAAYAINEML